MSTYERVDRILQKYSFAAIRQCSDCPWGRAHGSASREFNVFRSTSYIRHAHTDTHPRRRPTLPPGASRLPTPPRCPRGAGSSLWAPPGSFRGPPVRCSARRRLSEERKMHRRGVHLVEMVRLAELARPVRGHEAPSRAQGAPGAPSGRARRPHLRRDANAVTRQRA